MHVTLPHQLEPGREGCDGWVRCAIDQLQPQTQGHTRGHAQQHLLGQGQAMAQPGQSGKQHDQDQQIDQQFGCAHDLKSMTASLQRRQTASCPWKGRKNQRSAG